MRKLRTQNFAHPVKNCGIYQNIGKRSVSTAVSFHPTLLSLQREKQRPRIEGPLVTVRVNSKQSVRGLRSSITDHACPSVPLTSIFIPEWTNECPPRENPTSAETKEEEDHRWMRLLSLEELQTLILDSPSIPDLNPILAGTGRQKKGAGNVIEIETQ